MDTTQLLFTATLSITTIFLVIIGVQLIFILKELRYTLKKINEIIASFEKVGYSLDHGLSEVFGFLSGIKTLFKLVDIFHHKKNGKNEEK